MARHLKWAAFAMVLAAGQAGVPAPPEVRQARAAAQDAAPEVVLWVQEYPGYTTVEYAFHVMHYPRLVVLSDGTIFATERPRDWMMGEHVMYRGNLNPDHLELLAANMAELMPRPQQGGLVIEDAPTTTVMAATPDGLEQVTITMLSVPSYQIPQLGELEPDERRRIEHNLLFELLVVDLGRLATERYVPERLSLYVHALGPQVPEPMELPDWPVEELDLEELAARVDPQRGWFGSPLPIEGEEVVAQVAEQVTSGRGYRFTDGNTYQVFWHPELPVEMPQARRRP